MFVLVAVLAIGAILAIILIPLAVHYQWGTFYVVAVTTDTNTATATGTSSGGNGSRLTTETATLDVVSELMTSARGTSARTLTRFNAVADPGNVVSYTLSIMDADGAVFDGPTSFEATGQAVTAASPVVYAAPRTPMTAILTTVKTSGGDSIDEVLRVPVVQLPKSVGMECNSSEDCSKPSWCDHLVGRCTPVSGLGDPCVPGSCGAGFLCGDARFGNTCQPPGPEVGASGVLDAGWMFPGEHQVLDVPETFPDFVASSVLLSSAADRVSVKAVDDGVAWKAHIRTANVTNPTTLFGVTPRFGGFCGCMLRLHDGSTGMLLGTMWHAPDGTTADLSGRMGTAVSTTLVPPKMYPGVVSYRNNKLILCTADNIHGTAWSQTQADVLLAPRGAAGVEATVSAWGGGRLSVAVIFGKSLQFWSGGKFVAGPTAQGFVGLQAPGHGEVFAATLLEEPEVLKLWHKTRLVAELEFGADLAGQAHVVVPEDTTLMPFAAATNFSTRTLVIFHATEPDCTAWGRKPMVAPLVGGNHSGVAGWKVCGGGRLPDSRPFVIIKACNLAGNCVHVELRCAVDTQGTAWGQGFELDSGTDLSVFASSGDSVQKLVSYDTNRPDASMRSMDWTEPVLVDWTTFA